jgi:hypothetical protein
MDFGVRQQCTNTGTDAEEDSSGEGDELSEARKVGVWRCTGTDVTERSLFQASSFSSPIIWNHNVTQTAPCQGLQAGRSISQKA